MSSAPPSSLEAAPSRFAAFEGARVHYRSFGKGKEAVVFVHGFACDMTFWSGQLPALVGRTRVVLVDLPGHGLSDKPRASYTMEYFARSVDAVLKDAGVEKAVLVGHSMGTPVIVRYYRAHPDATLGLVAVDGALRESRMDPNQLASLHARYEAPEYRETIGSFVDSTFKPGSDPALRDRVKSVMQSIPQHVAVGAVKGMFDPSIWSEAPIEAPLLVVRAPSPFWSADNEAHVRKVAPVVDYRLVDGAGHFLMMEKPAAFNAILEPFLAARGVLKEPRA